jgi:hypothetical protein
VDWSRLANAWRYAFADLDAARRVLAAATRATPLGELGELASFRADLFDDEDDDDDPLEYGATIARTAEDWAALGVACMDVRRDWERADEHLRRALELAATDDQRAAIEREVHRAENLLARDDGDEGARQLAPEQLLPRRDSHGWRCDPRRLLAWLTAQLTDEQLVRIADNDYGYRSDESLAVLQGIRATGTIPTPMFFHVRENFELARWTRGHHTDHVERAFACTMLCVLGPGAMGGETESMAALVESCIALGTEAVDGMIELFAAMPEDPFIVLGIILGAAWRDHTDPRLPAQIRRLIAIERPYRYTPKQTGFLWRTSNFDQRYYLWQDIAREVLDRPHLRELAAMLGVAK